jgi:hypothetical protein
MVATAPADRPSSASPSAAGEAAELAWQPMLDDPTLLGG